MSSEKMPNQNLAAVVAMVAAGAVGFLLLMVLLGALGL